MHVLCHLPSGTSRPVLPQNPHQPAQRRRCCGDEYGQPVPTALGMDLGHTPTHRVLLVCPGLTDTKMIRYPTRGQMASRPASLDSPACNSHPAGGGPTTMTTTGWGALSSTLQGVTVTLNTKCPFPLWEHWCSPALWDTTLGPTSLGPVPQHPPRPPPHIEGPRNRRVPEISFQRGMGSPTHLHHITLLTVTARLPPSCHLPGSCVAWK